MRRLAWLVALLAAVPAEAQDFGGTVSPQSVVHGQDATVTWRITVETQEQPADFEISLSADGISPSQHGAVGFELTRVDTRSVRLEGPGTLEGGPMLISDPCYLFMDTGSRFGPPLEHGFDEDLSRYRVKIPAHSESVIVVPTATAPDAPWPGSSYGLDARVAERRLDLPRAMVGGRTGVPLAIATDPAGSSSICADPPHFTHGKPVAVSGRTDPALAGDRVTLDWYPPADAAARSLGDVVVQPGGWFELEGWIPPPGEHAVAARYASQRADRTDDFSHPQWFVVDEPPPPPPPPAASALAPALLGRPVVARGIVSVRLNCTAPSGCRGVARLHRSTRRLAARRYEVAEGVVARVRLRLPPRERRLLRRYGRLAAQVSVAPAGGEPAVHRVTLRRR